jgi:hypothetical protein
MSAHSTVDVHNFRRARNTARARETCLAAVAAIVANKHLDRLNTAHAGSKHGATVNEDPHVSGEM